MNEPTTETPSWYYVQQGEKIGPIGLTQIRELIDSGTIQRDAMVWHEGMNDWIAAGRCEELRDQFTEATQSRTGRSQVVYDKSAYPVRLEAEYPQKSSRILALLGLLFFIKALLILPHLIILYFVEIAVFVVAIIGYFAVLITGKYPRGLFEFVLGFVRWYTRIMTWLLGITDKYPPFSLS